MLFQSVYFLHSVFAILARKDETTFKNVEKFTNTWRYVMSIADTYLQAKAAHN
jgi:hypothetical protein